ncbi:MAG: zinc ribbon domain-containing protein [Candidatus Diapherotrites archaeon]
MPEEKVPRRLKRFYRQQESPRTPVSRETKKILKEGDELSSAIYGQMESKKEDTRKRKAKALVEKEVKSFKEKNKRLPKEDELEIIAGNIFEQLKKTEVDEAVQPQAPSIVQQFKEESHGEKKGETPFERRMRMRGERAAATQLKDVKAPEQKMRQAAVQPKAAAAGLSEEEKKKLSVAELFGEEKKDKKKGQEVPDEIDEDESMEELENLSIGEGRDSGMELEKGESAENACPNCGAETGEKIFCPECGEEFCEKCSKGVEVQQDAIRYTCPKCGKTFKVKKE